MTVIQTLLAGFFDYAGLYPPAGLSLEAAAKNYMRYVRGEHAWALGRFIINADRLTELRSTIGKDDLKQFRLSAIVSTPADADQIVEELKAGSPIETVEIKLSKQDPGGRVIEIPESLTTYLEMPTQRENGGALEMMSGLGVRAKIRMGGLAAEAFPDVSSVVNALCMLVEHRLCFKATAGLHHPIRSSQPLTYQPESPCATMHGFLNLSAAAAALYFGGDQALAEKILADEDRTAWQVDEVSLRWRNSCWTREQIATLRRDFFISIGSCSFEEPIRDLEALGWL